MNYSVILPTLNENGHIISLIDSITNIFKKKKLIYEIVIVDDNSTDGTIDTITNYKKNNNLINLIIRKNKKKNLAKSINEGIKQAKYENIIWMDADFQHPPKYIEEFIDRIQKHDAIIASRFLERSERYFQNKELEKDINENQSYFYNKLCKIFLFKDITDYTSGFICVKKFFFEEFELKGFYGDYFVNLISHLKTKKANILEIPFKDSKRVSGHSKTIVKINIKYIYTCLRYLLTLSFNIIKIRLNYYKNK